MLANYKDLPPLLTTREAAALLNIKPATLATWRSREPHRLPFVKMGGVVRYRLSDLLKVIEAGLAMGEESQAGPTA